MRAGLRRLSYLAFPPTCLLCAAAGQDQRDLCAGCEADLPRIECPCPGCGLPLGNPGHPRCGRCLRRAPVWDALFAPFRYDPPLDRLVHRFKYQGHLDAARLLGELMVAAVTTARIPRPDYLVPVPLHPRRLRERGFNQALEAARPLASAFGLPLLPGAAERVRPTVSQSGLSARLRRQNLRGAFVSREAPSGSHIAIIDDVVTTGATVAALTKTLKAAGVARVDVWALARAVVPF